MQKRSRSSNEMQSSASDTLRVEWLSVDPSSGDVHFYPIEIARRLEAAHDACMRGCADPDEDMEPRRSISSRNGLRGGVGQGERFIYGRRRVALAGFGGFFERAVVEMGGGEAPIQRTPGGMRDVRRIELDRTMTDVALHLVIADVWRVADEAIPGFTIEKRQALPATPHSSLILVACENIPKQPAPSDDAVESNGASLVPLWQWCRIVDPDDPGAVPDELWGVYGVEQQDCIEDGYQRNESRVQLEIGIRKYDIVFDGPELARQIDSKLNKVRLARRKLVSMQEKQERLSAIADAGDGDCALCFQAFSDTKEIPVIKLPGCGHCFHSACAQQLADESKPCPLCRADADWKNAFAQNM